MKICLRSHKVAISALSLFLCIFYSHISLSADFQSSPALFQELEGIQLQAQKDNRECYDQHFYSPSESDNAPEPCNTCASAGNQQGSTPESGPCGIYLQSRLPQCQGNNTVCTNSHASFTHLQSPGNYDSFLVKLNGYSCHYYVMPADPVIGVEDRNRRSRYNYFYQALLAAKTLVKVPPPDAGVAINAATERGQHQLHIHIGALPDYYRTAMETIARDNNWYKLVINGINYQGHFIPNNRFLGNNDPLDQVAYRFGEQTMPNSSIIVANANDQTGYFVISALNVVVEYELDYSYASCQ